MEVKPERREGHRTEEVLRGRNVLHLIWIMESEPLPDMVLNIPLSIPLSA